MRSAIFTAHTMTADAADRARTLLAVGAVSSLVALAFAPGDVTTSGHAATLLFAGAAGSRSDFVTMIGWLVGGSLVCAGVGYTLGSLLVLPLSTTAVVALGLALGGGTGAVAFSVASGDASRSEGVTVDVEADETSAPEPSDLFDGHPDPVLYVADRGHGPVVLAANRAFADAFDVPAEALSGTPLDEATMVAGDADRVVAAATGDDKIDVVRECATPDGERPFRLRTIGSGSDGYVLYTPVETGP